jgi:ATP-dependent Lon protease
MRKAKSSNPLFLLDEIDKMGAISAAIRRRLARGARSEQNTTFNDHYLEVDYDLPT